MDLKELCESIDIVEYISQYVDLEQRGDEFWGLSPFKDEKTPSFSIRPETGKWFDYSSGLGGNLYTFVKEYNKCSSSEAVNLIKNYAGIEGTLDSTVARGRMAATMVAKKFSFKKPAQKKSKATILPENYMERYEKRFEKLAIWADEGISFESLDKFQVAYDAFQDRIVYPIRNVKGQIINVSGRTLNPNWKGLNLRKYTYVQPLGVLDTIYGLSENQDFIKKSGEILLFEGAKSVMKADTWGIYNSAAILTSHLNPTQVKILANLGCRVVFCLDKGVDITKDHNIKRLKRYVRVEYLLDTENLLEEKEGPADRGPETFQKLYERRRIFR